jgi:Flp pilus assembly secretin CpaC
MSKNSAGVERVGIAFANIKAVLSGTKDDLLAVEHAIEVIGKANIKGGGALADLSNILNKPLKVEFANKNVNMVSNITLAIDGQRFMQKIFNPQVAQIKYEEARMGQGTT